MSGTESEAAPQMKILIVDDQAENVRIIASILKDLGQISFSLSGEDALVKARQQMPDLILLDVVMPDMSGYEVIDVLKKEQETSNIPVIFVTGLTDPDEEEEGLSRGAIDYITKPFHPSIVKARVLNQLRLREYSHRLETLNRELELLATTDPLTGAYNRRFFMSKAQEEVDRVRRYDRPCCLFLFDLDHFKQVNDNYGHDGGDQVLLDFVNLMNREIRQQDTFGRLGGEEFGLLLPETSLDAAAKFGERLLKAVRESGVDVDGQTIKYTSSVGASAIDTDTVSLDDTFKAADDALYRAKEEGRDRIVVSQALASA